MSAESEGKGQSVVDKIIAENQELTKRLEAAFKKYHETASQTLESLESIDNFPKPKPNNPGDQSSRELLN